MESKFKKKISDSVKEIKKKFTSVYDEPDRGVLIFGGDEEEWPEGLRGAHRGFQAASPTAARTPLEAWMRRYGMTKEEVMKEFPGKFNRDGSLKEVG